MRITTNATATAAIVNAEGIENAGFSPEQLEELAKLLEPHTNAQPVHVARAARRLQEMLRGLANDDPEVAIIFAE